MVGMTNIRGASRINRDAGFSLIEVLLVVGIMGVVTSAAVVQIGASRRAMQGDSGMRVVLSQLNTARELAVSQRRYMRVAFPSNNVIQILREDTPVTTTTLFSIPIEGGIQFVLMSGVPDTPDSFGRNAGVDFGSAVNVKFGPDGTLVNQDGVTTNGTVFVAIPNLTLTARAVTVLGSTGRVRGYKWNGKSWVLA